MDVSKNQLTDLTGKSYRTINSRLSDIPYESKGKAHIYNSIAALSAIYAPDIEVDYDYNEERARLTKFQADEKELQVQILNGDLIPSEQVIDLLQGVIANARAKLLTLPIKAAQAAIQATDVKDIEKGIQDLIFESLSELENGNAGNTGPGVKSLESSAALNS